MAKRLTPNQKEWEKELNRIQRFISRATNRGFIFEENIIPEKPKRITKKRLQALKSLRGKKLYESSQYITPFGARIPGIEGLKFEKKYKKSLKISAPHQSELVQDNMSKLLQKYSGFAEIMDLINSWSPDSRWSPQFTSLKRQDKNVAKNIITGQLRFQGEAIARRIEENATEIKELVFYIIYGASGDEKDNGDFMQSQLTHLATLLKGGSLSIDEARVLHDIQEGETI